MTTPSRNDLETKNQFVQLESLYHKVQLIENIPYLSYFSCHYPN
jgi:hypothetical protein